LFNPVPNQYFIEYMRAVFIKISLPDIKKISIHLTLTGES